MVKPYGRKTRQQVNEILKIGNRQAALQRLEKIPDKQLVGHLFSHFYNADELVKFRSVTAMGFVGERLADGHRESARNLMRRLMWNLNDESGGIGWGSAEAMGEILGRSAVLADEYASILFSFLDPKANYIDHPVLQQGVLWGIGTCISAFPDKMTPYLAGLTAGFLDAEDITKKGYAVRALAAAGPAFAGCLPEYILEDTRKIQMYAGWHFAPVRICDLARAGCGNRTESR